MLDVFFFFFFFLAFLTGGSSGGEREADGREARDNGRLGRCAYIFSGVFLVPGDEVLNEKCGGRLRTAIGVTLFAQTFRPHSDPTRPDRTQLASFLRPPDP